VIGAAAARHRPGQRRAAREAARVGQRVAGLDHFQRRRRAVCMAVLGHGERGHARKPRERRRGHRHRRLAHREDPVRRGHRPGLQRARDRRAALHRRDARAPDPFQKRPVPHPPLLCRLALHTQPARRALYIRARLA